MAMIYFPNGTTKEIETVSFEHVSTAVGDTNIEDVTDFVKLHHFNVEEKNLIKKHPHGTFYGVLDSKNIFKKPLYIFCVEC